MMTSALTFPRLLGFGFLATSFAGSAMASDTYVCTDGSSVTVELADLERMKQDNACVAAYYSKSTRSVAKTAGTGDKQASEASLALKPGVVDKAAMRAPAQVADFRRVRILNAGSGKPNYFIHSR